MACKLRIVIEKIDLESNKIIEKTTVDSFEIRKPEKIMDVGLRHVEQIAILRKIQQKCIDEQCVIVADEPQRCQKCKRVMHRNGYKQSDFHGVFSDHKVKLQKHRCPVCQESDIPSMKSLFGSNMHPDLYKLQCELGSAFSFYKSECQLEKLCQEKREINNHQRIKRTVNAVGTAMFELSATTTENLSTASSLIVQIDGGHIKDKSPEKRSFEALAAKIYRPEAVVKKKKRTVIQQKTCVASAKDDGLKSMKQLIESGAQRQGMSKNTKVTVLADGAKNCWQATSVLLKSCAEVEYVLDWFHLAKKFQPLLNASSLAEETIKKIEQIKWELWHGKREKAFSNLRELIAHLSDKEVCLKLKGLLSYLTENQSHLCHYSEREKQGLLFTSHVAESTVEHLINERHKRKQKMQWTRESADNVLQIRSAIASNEWLNQWELAVEKCIQKVA